MSSSVVVITREAALYPVWARIMSMNSWDKSTLDSSKEPPSNRPLPKSRGRPTNGSPEFGPTPK